MNTFRSVTGIVISEMILALSYDVKVDIGVVVKYHPKTGYRYEYSHDVDDIVRAWKVAFEWECTLAAMIHVLPYMEVSEIDILMFKVSQL